MYATRNGSRLYWTEQGTGEPLLLIMGLGATHVWWHRLTPHLAARFRTILFDNRGVGESDMPPGPYDMATMADDAVAVLDAANVDSAHVFGASMGGMIAQEVVLRHPRRVRSLILGCTACGGRDVVPAAREIREALNTRGTMTREESARKMVPYTFDAGTPRERIEEDLAIRLAANVPNDGYFAQLEAIRAWSGTFARLRTIATPTLVIHGETDALVPPENGRIIARAIPGAKLVMLPNASHIFYTDQLEASVDAILSFLGQQVAA
jgi:pimeloyl-ACP methyl ester carboxylesterase